MTTKQLKDLGAEHFAAGKALTPFDCREIDAKLFAIAKSAERPGKEYAKLRGAFNKGFMAAHAAAVMA